MKSLMRKGGGDMFSMYLGMKCKEEGIGFIQCWCMYMGLCILIGGIIILIVFLIIISLNASGVGTGTSTTTRTFGNRSENNHKKNW